MSGKVIYSAFDSDHLHPKLKGTSTFAEKQGMDQSETTNGDKTDVVKRLINYRVKFEAPDKQVCLKR